LTKIADEWRPWRAYAAISLWTTLAKAMTANMLSAGDANSLFSMG
jgi:3-methyladenine DNA glycosylase/8-oxoguanine DNA glycosylase